MYHYTEIVYSITQYFEYKKFEYCYRNYTWSYAVIIISRTLIFTLLYIKHLPLRAYTRKHKWKRVNLSTYLCTFKMKMNVWYTQIGAYMFEWMLPIFTYTCNGRVCTLTRFYRKSDHLWFMFRTPFHFLVQ